MFMTAPGVNSMRSTAALFNALFNVVQSLTPVTVIAFALVAIAIAKTEVKNSFLCIILKPLFFTHLFFHKQKEEDIGLYAKTLFMNY